MRMLIILRNPARQSGVSVVTAIFLIVVLALMGIGMVSILTTSQQSISQEITSAKAYAAGRSCLDWSMYQAIYDPDPWLNNPQVTTFTNSGLVNTKCTTTFNKITADGLTFFNIKTIATYGEISEPEYSQRTIQLQFNAK